MTSASMNAASSASATSRWPRSDPGPGPCSWAWEAAWGEAMAAMLRASVFRLAQPALAEVLSAAEAVLAATGNAVALCPVWGR